MYDFFFLSVLFCGKKLRSEHYFVIVAGGFGRELGPVAVNAAKICVGICRGGEVIAFKTARP